MAEVSRETKEQIKELFKAGHTMDEVRPRFQGIDGRVFSGLLAKVRQEQGAPEAPGSGTKPPPTPLPPMAPPSQVAPSAPKTPQAEASARTGFNPSSPSPFPGSPTGFSSNFQHYFIVKKMDGQDAGIIKKEFPPFGINEFLQRYKAPGDYEIQEYRDGRLFTTYSERVAPPYHAQPQVQIKSEDRKPDSPVDSFFKAVEAVDRIQNSAEAKAAAARAAEAQAKAEEARENRSRESAATVSLVSLLDKQMQPKPDTLGPALNQVLQVMQQNSQDAVERHKRDMEELRERQKHEREMTENKIKQERDAERERLKSEREAERERIKAENDRFRDEMKQREKDRDALLTKMAEIEKDRDEFHRASYDRMMGEIKDSREAVHTELAERRKWMEDVIASQKKSADEFIEMKKSLIAAGGDTETTKMVVQSIANSIDRLGHRAELLLKDKKENGIQLPGVRPQGSMAGAAAADGTPKTEVSVLTDEEARLEVKNPWFQKLKREILMTLSQREKGLKLHGGILGQVFLEELNTPGKGVTTAHLHWLCSREWPQVLDNAKSGLNDDEMKKLNTKDGEKWFIEFQWFLSEAYNNSLSSVGKG